MAIAILGGVFDPPHEGHLALGRAAVAELRPERLLVLVIAGPGHKGAVTPAETRFELADFESWKEPHRVLELARLAVAMRPGVPRDEVDAVRRRLDAGDRIVEFDLKPVPIASSGIRARVALGEPIDDLVPASVAEAIGRLGLYATPE